MDSWFFLSFPRWVDFVAGPEGAKNLAGESPPPDSESVENFESEKNLVRLLRKNHRARIADSNSTNAVNFSSACCNVTLSVVAMRISDPDCSSLRIHS
jgi:hypothetical protein